ncbi:MAG: sigma-70 family RNA polymerase sigma factor [Gemmataceae bacterium]
MSAPRSNRPARPVMMAVVLGTALSTFGADRLAAAEAPLRDLGRYCTTCWRNARVPMDAWSDCTQEVFKRMLERVPTARWEMALQIEGEERREFLRAIDTVKKRAQRAKRYSDAVDHVADIRVPHDTIRTEERETVFQAAEELLSDRQQQILKLSFDGWTVQEIAEELCLPAERISDEKYKGIRKLRAHLTTQEG